jgi:hypothetical protein
MRRLFLTVVPLTLGLLPSAWASKSDAAAVLFEVNDCKACHETAVTGMQGTPHAGLENSCAACHGDPTAHLQSNLEKGEPGPITSIKSMKPAEVSNVPRLPRQEATGELRGGDP